MLTCPRCGQENSAGARFCNSCGAELAEEPSHEVRKTVTVLFADVTGSTALGERLDPEAFRRVMARYFEVAREAVEHHGGTVEKFIGDAVMAVFGVPAVHEDDGLRAVRAAAELRGSLDGLNVALERDYGVSLGLRTGVNTGEVVAGTRERLATGDAVNVAARLEQAAEPGEILLGERTTGLVRNAVEVEAAEPLTVKGKSEPLKAHRLIGVVEGAPAFERRPDGPFVGRRAEVDQVRAAFDDALSKRTCGMVLVLGPPGIGKSRLATEAARALEGEAAVASGRCLPYGDGITYWPLTEIFHDLGAEAELEEALSTSAPEEIFWSVRKALERRAREQPLALVVDDIHWAEPTLLDLLDHLTEWTRDAPLLLLGLARPEVVDARPAWEARAITLEPLSGEESDSLIGGLAGADAIDGEARARIREVAEGNPLFVEQLLAMLADGGDLAEVPPSMQALLAARLDTLPENELGLLERAAVAGLEFGWDDLAALASDGRRPAGAELASLVRKELIRPHEATEDAFRFRHMLIRDAAYDGVPKELRADLHARFADWLEGRGQELDEIVGYHLERAARCLAELGPETKRGRELGERAADRLGSAGRRALARGDARGASTLLERTASLLPPDDPNRLDALLSCGQALLETGEMEQADALLTEAAERASAAGHRGIAAGAAVTLDHLHSFNALGPEITWEEASERLDEAAAVFEDLHDDAGLAHVLGVGGLLRFWAGDAEPATGILERSIQHARLAGDRAQEVQSLRTVLLCDLHGPKPVEEALARLDDARIVSEANRVLEVDVLRVEAQLEAMRERFDTARDRLERASELFDEAGLVYAGAGIAWQGAYVELLAGNPAAAERWLLPAWDAMERVNNLAHIATAAPLLADALLDQGKDDEASERIEAGERGCAPGDVDAEIGLRRVRARLLARRGDLAGAERLAREAVARGRRTDYIDLLARTTADLSEILRLTGRSADSSAAVEEAIRLYELKGNVAAAADLRSARVSAL